MPVYECTNCGALDNTAIGGYWDQQFDAYTANVEHKPLCSECYTGTWHGAFPKQMVKDLNLEKDANGFLQERRGTTRQRR